MCALFSISLDPFLHVVAYAHSPADAPTVTAEQLLEGVAELRREDRVDDRVQCGIEVSVNREDEVEVKFADEVYRFKVIRGFSGHGWAVNKNVYTGVRKVGSRASLFT